MISLSDAIRLESANPAVNTFKPWWEIWVDHTLNAFLLVVLFALAGVTISGTPGLVCLSADTNQTSLNYATNFYVNAKCTTHVDGHILIVFPYIIFAQWLILFVLHLSWFNLPSLKAFLASSFDTFQVLKKEGNPRIHTKMRSRQQLEKTQPQLKQYDLSNVAVDDEPDEDNPENAGRDARLVYLVDWLQYLLQFRYNLVTLYIVKSTATCVLTFILSGGLISWLVSFQWRTAFSCNLEGHLPSPYDYNSCSFPAAPYVYSMMILDAMFTIALFMFNLQALIWFLKFRYSYRNYKSKLWNDNHPLRGKPGFYDYFFCLQLLRENNAEGDIVFKTVEEAFKIFQNEMIETKVEVVSESVLVIPEIPSHCKHQFVVTEVLKELGMTIKRSKNGRDDLWAALANSLEQEKPALDLKELSSSMHEVHECVLKELLEKHALFKDLINKDDHCLMFDDYIDDVKLEEPREKGIKEDHYILMAFAIAYKVNLVVIRAEKSSLLYEPEKPEENQSVRFVTFIPPHYYYSASADSAAASQEGAGLKFLTDQVYQTDLLKAVNEKWESKGFEEYKKNLENILPRELPHQPSVFSRSISELDTQNEGVRFRVSKSKSDKKKIEHFALMESA